MQESITLVNKMIDVYNNTDIEQYPQARALDLLDSLDFNSRERQYAFNLFNQWLKQNESEV